MPSPHHRPPALERRGGPACAQPRCRPAPPFPYSLRRGQRRLHIADIAVCCRGEREEGRCGCGGRTRRAQDPHPASLAPRAPLRRSRRTAGRHAAPLRNRRPELIADRSLGAWLRSVPGGSVPARRTVLLVGGVRGARGRRCRRSRCAAGDPRRAPTPCSRRATSPSVTTTSRTSRRTASIPAPARWRPRRSSSPQLPVDAVLGARRTRPTSPAGRPSTATATRRPGAASSRSRTRRPATTTIACGPQTGEGPRVPVAGVGLLRVLRRTGGATRSRLLHVRHRALALRQPQQRRSTRRTNTAKHSAQMAWLKADLAAHTEQVPGCHVARGRVQQRPAARRQQQDAEVLRGALTTRTPSSSSRPTPTATSAGRELAPDGTPQPGRGRPQLGRRSRWRQHHPGAHRPPPARRRPGTSNFGVLKLTPHRRRLLLAVAQRPRRRRAGRARTVPRQRDD
jgi:hypothetical protein